MLPKSSLLLFLIDKKVSKFFKIKQFIVLSAGLLMLLHILLPHHHHYSVEDSHFHLGEHLEVLCHQHHSTDAPDALACHSLNELTVAQKKPLIKKVQSWVQKMQNISVFYLENKDLYWSTTKAAPFDTVWRITDFLITRTISFRGPPVL